METIIMPFNKGKSGNPGGRPKKTQEDYNLEQAARQKGVLETLVTIMEQGEIERNRMSTAQYILERGYGNPAQTILANQISEITATNDNDGIN
jgi:hypothetical protein